MDAFSRPSFSQRFLNVCQQLEALQPVSISAAPSSPQRVATTSDRDPSSPSSGRSSLSLLSRDRMFQIFASSECFRPSEELVTMASGNKEDARSSASPTRTAMFTPLSPSAPALSSPRRSIVGMSSTTPSESRKDRKSRGQNIAVHVPVGGKARVLPSQALQRARAALKKRSNALANLHPTAMGSLPLDKRRALHNAPDGTWEALRQLPSAGGVGNQLDGVGASSSSTLPPPGKQALIAELMNKTNFSTQSIFQMSRKFKLIAGSAKSVISFDEFRQIMSDDVGDLLLSIGISGASVSGECEQNQDDGEQPRPPTADMTAIGATISSSETFLRRLFLTFDADGDGKIDFREFVVGLNGFVKGTPEEKVHALFEIYKSDSAGNKDTVAISDLLGLFQGDRHLYQELMRCVDEYFARVELRDELQPTMKEDEFVAASVAEPHLLDMVSRPVPSRRYAGEAHVREKIRAFIEQKRINWKKLLQIHRRMVDYARTLNGSGSASRRSSGPEDAELRRRSVLQLPSTPTDSLGSRSEDDAGVNFQTLAIPVADFHQILAECLGPVSAYEDESLTQSILLAYVSAPREKLPSTPPAAPPTATHAPSPDTQGSGVGAESVRRERPARRASIMEHYVAHVACGELTQDVAVALQTALTAEIDADSKARYYFELYDLNGDGLLSRSELCTAICAGFGHFGQSMMDVVRILEDEDSDQDGEVTKDEYMRAANKSPLILASLYTCLQRDL